MLTTIQNKKREVYKKYKQLEKAERELKLLEMRSDLEDIFGYARGDLATWTGKEIEYHYYENFQQ